MEKQVFDFKTMKLAKQKWGKMFAGLIAQCRQDYKIRGLTEIMPTDRWFPNPVGMTISMLKKEAMAFRI